MDVARGFSLTLSPHFLYYLFKDLRPKKGTDNRA
jgi:hypothetical protein